jgi:TPR repeat protein
LPTVESLKIISPFLDGLTEGERLAWAEDVIRLNVWSSRFPRGATDASRPPAYSRSKTISLEELLQRAVLLVISLTAQSDLSAAPSAAYLKGKLLASGLCEEYLPQDHQRAVKEFKLAAGRGEARAWSALGERYESLGQTRMARECYERGIEEGDCESTYVGCSYFQAIGLSLILQRIGIGYLLGNLDLSRDPSRALSLLQRSAKTATIDSPHPAFTYGLILADLLPLPTPLPPSLHPLHTIPTSGAYLNRLLLAQRHIRRAAYLHYSPAQLFLGKAYERSLLGLPYNPQMSVGWYLLASAEGEEEADMALSRWYLCGAGEFVKVDEVEARRYAESAADRGHPDGCFAMGYYFE